MKRLLLLAILISSFCWPGALPYASAQQATSETIEVDPSAQAHQFPHFWEQMFGSGRAVLALRDDYRRDLSMVKTATDFKYIRFHAILDRDVGVYDEDASGRPIYNFSYVDQIYDGLLARGVRPYVELSFMPPKLAAEPIQQAFWYHPIVAPPKDWNLWGDLITQFMQHLVNRYGIDQVSQWYFEVWNEPNLDFWAGDPKQETYFHLYDVAARAIKNVNPRLRVGGPATAQAAWVDAFIRHCAENHVPVDFVSTHVYANDTSHDVFGTDQKIPRNKMVCLAVHHVRDQIEASTMPHLPLIWSEYNASYKNEVDVTDSPYMAPWLADTIRQCDGLTTMMSYWAFSDVFEEQGVIKKPFYGGYGLVAEDDIPKASFNAFAVLHHLGNQRIALDSDSALLTRDENGRLELAVWNLFPPEEKGYTKRIVLQFKHMAGSHIATILRVDAEHGSPLRAYYAMGQPAYPTTAQVESLRNAAKLSPPQTLTLQNGQLSIEMPSQSLALIQIQ